MVLQVAASAKESPPTCRHLPPPAAACRSAAGSEPRTTPSCFPDMRSACFNSFPHARNCFVCSCSVGHHPHLRARCLFPALGHAIPSLDRLDFNSCASSRLQRPSWPRPKLPSTLLTSSTSLQLVRLCFCPGHAACSFTLLLLLLRSRDRASCRSC